jgi:hypothetical protein
VGTYLLDTLTFDSYGIPFFDSYLLLGGHPLAVPRFRFATVHETNSRENMFGMTILCLCKLSNQ